MGHVEARKIQIPNAKIQRILNPEAPKNSNKQTILPVLEFWLLDIFWNLDLGI
jgi:hypothetical protein